MRRSLAVLFVAAAVVGLAFLGFGLFLPEEHVVTTSARIDAPPEAVWARVADLEGWPKWLDGATSMERLGAAADGETWRVQGEAGASTLVVHAREPGRLLAARVLEAPGGFRGTWTYDLTPSEGGETLVRVTENATVSNPFQRVAMVLTSDPSARLSAFLVSLARSFEREEEPVR